jgi:hypothetical protein
VRTPASWTIGRALLARIGVEPRQYQVLVDLFGTLGERNELVSQLAANATAMRLTSLALLIPGGFIALTALRPSSLASYNLMTVVTTALVLFLLLVMETGEAFFNPAEAVALAHHPINGATYFAAKFTSLVLVVWRAELALNGPAAIAGLMKPEARWFYPLTHMASAWIAGVCLALVTCAVFGVLARVLPSSRLRSAALWLQLAIFTLPPIIGLTIPPLQRMAGHANLHLDTVAWSVLPSAWFNALGVIGQAAPVTPLGWPAAIGMGVLAIGIAFGIRSLSAGYLTRAIGVMRGGRSRRRRLPLDTGGRLVGALSRRPSGRAAFGFLMRMMAGDWQFRRAAMQFGMLAFIGLPAILLSSRAASPFGPGRLSLVGLLPEFLPFFTMMICSLLAYSDQYRGAWIFQTVPDAGLRGYARGIYWSIWLVFLVVPLVAASVFYAPYWGLLDAALFGAFGLAVASLLLGTQLLLIDGLPFGHPAKPERTYMLMAAIIFGPIVIGIAWIVQSRFIYLSRWATAAAAVVFTGVAVIVVRYGLRALNVKIRSDLARVGGASLGMFDTANG